MKKNILFIGLFLLVGLKSLYAEDLYHHKGELKDLRTVSKQEAEYIFSNYNLLSSTKGNINNLSEIKLKDIGCVSAYLDSQNIWVIWNRCPKPIKFSAEFRQGFFSVNYDDEPLGPDGRGSTGLNYTWELVYLHDKYA